MFKAVYQGAEQVWNHAISMLSDYKKATKFCILGPSACEVSWKKPQARVFKINTDGATADNGRRLSIGVIIRDSRGEAVAALCRVLPRMRSFIGLQWSATLTKLPKQPLPIAPCL